MNGNRARCDERSVFTLTRARYSATRKRRVRRNGVIVHVGSGWSARRRAGNGQVAAVAGSSVIRSDVRSAWAKNFARPCTGSRTSAIRAANTASTVDTRRALTFRLESPSENGAEENAKEVT
jgi:hypothetical protein